MSQFECINGHEIPPGKFICPRCGLGIHTMDGITNQEMREMDGWDDVEERYYDYLGQESKIEEIED